MKYRATWYMATGRVTITEYPADADAEDGKVIYEGRNADLILAAEEVREQGYTFLGMWTCNSADWQYKAPLEPAKAELPPA